MTRFREGADSALLFKGTVALECDKYKLLLSFRDENALNLVFHISAWICSSFDLNVFDKK